MAKVFGSSGLALIHSRCINWVTCSFDWFQMVLIGSHAVEIGCHALLIGSQDGSYNSFASLFIESGQKEPPEMPCCPYFWDLLYLGCTTMFG